MVISDGFRVDSINFHQVPSAVNEFVALTPSLRSHEELRSISAAAEEDILSHVKSLKDEAKFKVFESLALGGLLAIVRTVQKPHRDVYSDSGW